MNKSRTLDIESADTFEKMVGAQKAKPGFPMDSYFYQSEFVYRRELERFVFRSWLYAAHVSEIPVNGSYVLFEVGDDSIIVNRDLEGKINAFHNICRHRGSRICEELSGKRRTLVCPYHGWAYNMDGSLRPPRDMGAVEGFDKLNYSLMPVLVEEYMGLIFVNFDDKAQSFLPTLQKIAAPLGAYELADAKIAHQHTYQINANWKLSLENYLECYHCASSHRHYARSHSLKELYSEVEDLNNKMLAGAESKTGIKGIGLDLEDTYTDAEHFGGCLASSRYALYDGYITGSQDGKQLAPLMGQFQGFDGGVGDFQLGPLTFMLNYPDHCVLYRYIPRGKARTDLSVVWFVRGDAQEGQDYDVDKLTWLWHQTTLEDEYIITRNSAGVLSKYFEPGPYHPVYEQYCTKFVNCYLHEIGL